MRLPRLPAPQTSRLVAVFGLGASVVWAAGCLDWARLQHGRCGDGFVGPEELCDDGNALPGDGCSARCRLELPACGNLSVDEKETCDDGNLRPGDGCDASCQVEPARCGDGRTDAGEECDDANTDDADACVAECRVARCGDGKLWEFVEECDDGGAQAGDGCSPSCKLELELCGNGRLDGSEACDDGNGDDGDGCSAECLVEPPLALCGNGRLDPDEACDDGNESSNDLCLKGCSRAACGDGFVRRGVEECDDGNSNNGDDCTRACMLCSLTDGAHFRTANSHCYTLHPESKTQGQARAICQAEGGDLWTVTSQGEGNDVVAKLELGDAPLWLGLTTKAAGIGWVSGEGTNFTSFDVGEPSDPALTCVSLVLDADGNFKWRSEACGAKHGFVCERVPPVIYAPTHHAYRVHTGAWTFEEAEAACLDAGGSLATFESDAERAFVGKAVSVVAWIGASDREAEGSFEWLNGEPVATEMFAAGQPNDADGSADCGSLNLADRITDEKCESKRGFVCELE